MKLLDVPFTPGILLHLYSNIESVELSHIINDSIECIRQ